MIGSKRLIFPALVFATLLASGLACSLSAIGEKPVAALVVNTPVPLLPSRTATFKPTISSTTPPTPTPIPATPTVTSVPDVSFQGITFSFDHGIASAVRKEMVAAVSGQDVAPWDIAPEHDLFSFDGYVLHGTFHNPEIRVYPVERFKQMDPDIRPIFDKLKQLLEQKPASPDSIPFLPVFNAAQLMQAQVKYLRFQSGSGVRFLTQYAQDVSPINNTDIFYTYQGMTDDGRYYVSVILPVYHSSLPADASTIPGGDFATYSKNYTNIIAQMEEQLNGQPPASFSPSLIKLDGMVGSILVSK